MAHKAMGLWLGAAVLAGSACTTTSGQARSNSGTSPPVASSSQVAATPAATPAPDGAPAADQPAQASSADATAGAPDSATAAPAASDTPAASADRATPDTSSGSTAANDNAPSAQQQKSEIIASADGTQAATVKDFSNGALTIASHHAKGKAHLSTMGLSDSTPIFEGDTRVGTDALTPGTDVRVFYKNPISGSQREVLGIDIVTPGQGSSAPKDSLQSPGDREPSQNTGTANPSDENPSPGAGTNE